MLFSQLQLHRPTIMGLRGPVLILFFICLYPGYYPPGVVSLEIKGQFKVPPEKELWSQFPYLDAELSKLTEEQKAQIPFQVSSVFQYLGVIYPRALTAHLIAEVPLPPFSTKVAHLNKLYRALLDYEIPHSYRTSKAAVRQLNQTQYQVKELIDQAAAMTNQTLDLLDLSHYGEHSNAIYKSAYGETIELGNRLHKRQAILIGAVIAGAATSLITTLLTSGNADEVLGASESRVLVQKLDHDSLVINRNSADIEAFNKTITHMENDIKLAFVNRDRQHSLDIFNMVLNTVERACRNIREQMLAINECRLGKFNINLLSLSDIQKALKDLGAQALENNLVLSITHPLELENLDTTVVLQEDRLQILISIPLEEQISYSLYQLRTYATPTGFQWHGTDMYMRFSNPDTLLLLNKEQTLYSTLSLAELSNCKHINKKYFCPSVLTIYKTARKNCLLSLYQNNRYEIIEECPIQTSTDNEKAVKLDDSSYLIIEKTALTQSCVFPNQTTKVDRFEVKKPSIIKVLPGCVVNSPIWTIDRSAVELSHSLEATITYHDIELEDFINYSLAIRGLDGRNSALDGETVSNFKTFLYEATKASRATTDVNTVAMQAVWHDQWAKAGAQDKLASSKKWQWPSLSGFFQHALQSIVSVLVFTFIIWVIFRLSDLLCTKLKAKMKRSSPRRAQAVQSPLSEEQECLDFRRPSTHLGEHHATPKTTSLGPQVIPQTARQLSSSRLNIAS